MTIILEQLNDEEKKMAEKNPKQINKGKINKNIIMKI